MMRREGRLYPNPAAQRLGSATGLSFCPLCVHARDEADSPANIAKLPELLHERARSACVYSITLSARATSNGGSSIPRVFAVFRLMLNSNLVGW